MGRHPLLNGLVQSFAGRWLVERVVFPPERAPLLVGVIAFGGDLRPLGGIALNSDVVAIVDHHAGQQVALGVIHAHHREASALSFQAEVTVLRSHHLGFDAVVAHPSEMHILRTQVLDITFNREMVAGACPQQGQQHEQTWQYEVCSHCVFVRGWRSSTPIFAAKLAILGQKTAEDEK